MFARRGLLCYGLTSALVIAAVLLAHQTMSPAADPLESRDNLVRCFAAWDGRIYREILLHGYTYDPETGSTIGFFPAYPLLAWLVMRLTCASPELALVLTANACLAGTFVLLAAYLRQRETTGRSIAATWVLLALGLFPTTFFFRMAYSESLLLLLTVLSLYAMERGWSLLLTAVIVGVATAVRPVGIGLLLPFLFYLRKRSQTVPGFVARCAYLVPLGCWGLAAFILYQQIAFNEPLAFALCQLECKNRELLPLPQRLLALAILEPIWAVFTPSSVCYWGRHDLNVLPVFSLYVANPIFFVLTVVLVTAGALKRWLSSYETALAVSLLAIPYVSRGHEMCMASSGRYAAVVFPAYLVLGQLLARLPRVVAILLLVASGLLLGIYSAKFALWYPNFY
jgi:hypothetical protein